MPVCMNDDLCQFASRPPRVPELQRRLTDEGDGWHSSTSVQHQLRVWTEPVECSVQCKVRYLARILLAAAVTRHHGSIT